MLKKEDITTKSWADYELLDSGNGRKLERFGKIMTDRPDTQAIWMPLKTDHIFLKQGFRKYLCIKVNNNLFMD